MLLTIVLDEVQESSQTRLPKVADLPVGARSSGHSVVQAPKYGVSVVLSEVEEVLDANQEMRMTLASQRRATLLVISI